MKEGKIYNFILPNELREYLNLRSKEKHTKVSQYIIDLIVKDKENNSTKNNE